MPVPYTKKNTEIFYLAVKLWASKFTEQQRPQFDFSQTKIKKQKLPPSQNPRPFSIMHLKNHQGISTYVAVSNMQVAEPGGFGRIKVCYLITLNDSVMQIHFDKPQALKIMRGRESYSNPFAKSFSQQYIPGFCDALRDEQSGKYYYLMPLYEGMALIDYLNFLLEQRKLLPNKLFFTICIQAAKHIKQLHDQGYGHYDIKPDNFVINICNQGVSLYMIDFDFVNKFGEPIVYTGTPAYTAPELLDRTATVSSHRHDVYSFAEMIDVMATIIEWPMPRLAGFVQYIKHQRLTIDDIISWLFQLNTFGGIYPPVVQVNFFVPSSPVLSVPFTAEVEQSASASPTASLAASTQALSLSTHSDTETTVTWDADAFTTASLCQQLGIMPLV